MHQDAFHDVDTYTPLEKQYKMMELILSFFDIGLEALEQGVSVDSIVKIPVRERIGRFKYVANEKIETEFKLISEELQNEVRELIAKEEA